MLCVTNTNRCPFDCGRKYFVGVYLFKAKWQDNTKINNAGTSFF